MGEKPWRVRVGAALLGIFVVAMAIAGAVLADDRVVPSSDGREVDLGQSFPGPVDVCVDDVEQDVLPNCYRERIDRQSFVKQPVSTVTTLAFCAVGLVILWCADRSRPSPTRRDHTWVGFVALFMGPGSAVFHGTLTAWGGWFDQLSMYALLSVIVAVDGIRLVGRDDWFARFFLGGMAVAVAIRAGAGSIATLAFIATGVGVGVFALVAWTRLARVAARRRRGARLALAYGVLAAAIVPWVLSNPASGDPTTIPYHGAWHVLSAAFVAAYWWYLLSETADVPADLELAKVAR